MIDELNAEWEERLMLMPTKVLTSVSDPHWFNADPDLTKSSLEMQTLSK
jgi:hypothetical protein